MIMESEKNVTVWLKISSLVFGLWAAALPVTAVLVTRSQEKVVERQNEIMVRVEGYVKQQNEFQRSFDAYVLLMERRMTVIEERQNDVRARLQIVEQDNKSQDKALIRNGK
jgi:hypothetical protein